MNEKQFLKNLSVPSGMVDVVIDTDTYNEVDDQFAVAYLLASKEKVNLQALYAAPFFNPRSSSPADGMEKSYQELCTLLNLTNRKDLLPVTFRGSDRYLPDESTPVLSEAVTDLVQRASQYTPEKPLYVITIGAITNIASALLLQPDLAEKIVVVWLGGHAHHLQALIHHNEFNLKQDVAAARVVFQSGVPLVQLSCRGVVNCFSISYAEMTKFLKGKNALCDFLVDTVREELGDRAETEPCARVIWDVTAVAWLLNDDNRFMESAVKHRPLPEYNGQYSESESSPYMQYVCHIYRDALAKDLFDKLTIKENLL